jgi:lipopolysaccharide transport system permease protein
MGTTQTVITNRTKPPEQILPLLSQEPLVTIEPTGLWVALNLRLLWPYRELLYFLVWRDIKVRYKQTAFGVAWVVMQPVLMTIIFTVFLGKLARVPSSTGVPYVLFAYSGLLLWTFFSGAISVGQQCLLANAALITKIYFPRLIIPCAAIGGRLIDLLISFTLLVGLLLFYRIHLSWSILGVAIPVTLVVFLSLGFSLLTAALNVKYRDIGLGLPVMIQLWMFVSPIVYPLTLVPQKWRWLYSLNPLVGIIESFRAFLFNLEIDRWALTVSSVVTIVLLVYSAHAFRRMEKGFADLI